MTPAATTMISAFFNIPVVGSERLELQRELFPETSVSPFALQDAVEKATALLESTEWAAKVGQEAHDALVTNYDYEKSLERFNLLLSKVRGG